MTQTEPDVAQSMSLLYEILGKPAPEEPPGDGRIDDLRTAVRVAEELLAAFSHLDDVRDSALYYAAWAEDELFARTGEPAHLDREIEHLRGGLAAGMEGMAELLVDALSLRQDLAEDGAIADIDEAVRLQRAVVARAAQEDLVEAKAYLGMLVAQRFRESPPDDPDQLANLDDGIGLLTEVQHVMPADDENQPRIVAALGHLLVMSHFAPRMGPDTPRTNDLDRGIALLRSVAGTNAAAADRLVFALDHRFSQSKRREDREEAIALAERLCADDPGYLDHFAAELGELYTSRLTDDGDQDAFEPAVGCLTHAIRQRRPDMEYLEIVLVELHMRRHGRVPPPDELVRLRDLAVEVSADEEAPGLWTSLVLAVEAQTAVVSGDPVALAACIARFTEAALVPLADDDDRVLVLAVLAAMIAQLDGHGLPWPEWSPFAMMMDPAPHAADLLDWLFRVQDLLPPDSPDHPMFVVGTAMLATNLDRDVDEYAPALEHALTTLPTSHPLHHVVAYTLGRQYLANSSSTPSRERSSRTIELLTSAATGFAADDPIGAECIGCLGSAVFTAYTCGFVDQGQIRRADELISGALANPGLDREFKPLLLTAHGQVRGISWMVDPASGDIGSGVRLHEQALSMLPPDHPTRMDVLYSLSNLLIGRSVITRNLDDVAAAEVHLTALVPLAEAAGSAGSPSLDSIVDQLRTARLLRLVMDDAVREEDVPELEEIISGLEEKAERSANEDGLIAWARMALARQRGDQRQALDMMAHVAAVSASLPEEFAFKKTLDSLGDMAGSAHAALEEDATALLARIDAITARAEEPGIAAEERARLLFMMSGLWDIAHTRYGVPEYLENAIIHFERCHRLAAATTEPFSMFAAEKLSDLYWRRGPDNAERVAHWGFVALREHSRQVLLHTEIAHGTAKASKVVEHAHTLALRCATMGELERAVAAIESGRGLTMYLATAADGVGAVLRELGHEDVALEWEHSFRARRSRRGEVPVPGDLRYRVLDLLAGTDAEQRLLSPPTPAQIAEALRVTGRDALVYLVPAIGQAPGRALIIHADASVSAVPLPHLTTSAGGEVERYLTAHRRATTTTGTEQADAVRSWRRELDELLWWAWPAVVDPVLTEVERGTGGQPPRLVLVPCGALGIVPWQAARNDTGRGRFAIHRAVFSYAPSARLLCEAAARPVMPVTEDVAVVANPTEDLLGSVKETRYLHGHLYPDAMYHGLLPHDLPQDGEGSLDDVLALLPTERTGGMSVLHLACHASTGPTPAASYLDLADGTLTVARMLEHSSGRPKSGPGGLVVLAACQSDLADRDHDEALTVATAFLAGGATSVVGTRWSVSDLPSAVLMCLFHRHLVVDELPPADALRAAQLWAADPDSVLPDDIASVFGVDRCDIPLTTWAAFSHQGR